MKPTKTTIPSGVTPAPVEMGGDKDASPDLHPVHGIMLTIVNAIVAELILVKFIAEESLDYPAMARVARIILVFLCLYTIHRFALRSLRAYRPKLKDLICLSSIILGSILMIWAGDVFSIGLRAYAETAPAFFGGEFSDTSFHYAIPFAAGALVLQAILGLHYGLVFALCVSVLMGFYAPGGTLLFVPYVLVTCIVACLSLVHFRSRSAYIKAGFNIALVSLPFVLASLIIDSGQLYPGDIFLRVLGGVISGILCTFLAAGITPVAEYLGGYVTDLRLIEMATLDHPLLKDLSLQAPGTWNHSMVMGMMAESAADAIGANPVLARVSAYFHDVGKVKKPLYFVENQGGGENRHDKLSTSMSALIIRSHVKDGIELSRKHRLPKPIEDMIPQHHGTSVIEYFYKKALKEAEESEENIEVDKSLYTYPGPKPQTREAGILMLADGIEAATRTLHDPSLDRIQGLVQKMINKVFASGELNECELTLRDLHLIAKCFTRVLNGIYHQRISYFEPAEKVREKVATQQEEKREAEQKKDKREKRKKKAKGSKEETKNLETEKSPSAKGEAEDEVKDIKDKESKEPDKNDKNEKSTPKEDLKRLGL